MATTLDLLAPPLRILLISPQPWAGLQVSKHHYARELAALGHTVYFVNPPNGGDAIRLSPSDVPGITLVDHPRMPASRTKYRAQWLFIWAARRRAKAIARAVGPVDLLWDFDNARQFADHRAFAAPFSILHVVDMLDPGDTMHRHADLILGVDELLIAEIAPSKAPRHVVGHGLSPLFARAAQRRLAAPRRRDADAPVTVGFIGNLAQPAMDRERFARLVAERPDCLFRFIGPVQGGTPESHAWADTLAQRPNVELAGLLTGDALIAAAEDVDVWLLLYDYARDRNRGVNSHKLLEYFALGGEVVSSPIAAQAGAPGIFMAPREAPGEIGAKLDAAIAAVREGRDTGWRKRVELALANSYRAHAERIAAHLKAVMI
ncbi:hypothetical protein ASD67_21840 [Sphingopyxis sp. Root1497]|uniref:hypothetical protein n=1 Tax=Sphingopyxis sp. Root1497 TaxID=1736474 RepID=UPI0007017C3A|nr:hypothetical protein [Sphingopyxis sp. Root1497]KQZ61815.1 hypothetical protein ASD67_21840 [Sphingopyxis sp. Root1497]